MTTTKTKTTKAPKTREEIRASIREFAKQMSPAPEPKTTTLLELDAETRRIWTLIENA